MVLVRFRERNVCLVGRGGGVVEYEPSGLLNYEEIEVWRRSLVIGNGLPADQLQRCDSATGASGVPPVLRVTLSQSRIVWRSFGGIDRTPGDNFAASPSASPGRAAESEGRPASSSSGCSPFELVDRVKLPLESASNGDAGLGRWPGFEFWPVQAQCG